MVLQVAEYPRSFFFGVTCNLKRNSKFAPEEMTFLKVCWLQGGYEFYFLQFLWLKCLPKGLRHHQIQCTAPGCECDMARLVQMAIVTTITNCNMILYGFVGRE